MYAICLFLAITIYIKNKNYISEIYPWKNRMLCTILILIGDVTKTGRKLLGCWKSIRCELNIS